MRYLTGQAKDADLNAWSSRNLCIRTIALVLNFHLAIKDLYLLFLVYSSLFNEFFGLLNLFPCIFLLVIFIIS